MLSKEAFVDFILKGAAAKTVVASAGSLGSALPEGFEEFDVEDAEQTPFDDATFARRLLEAADFGLPELVARDSVIRSTDAVARYLPDRVAYWPKTPSRPYQTLLFESTVKSDDFLRIPAFRHTQLHHLNDVEAALARLVSQALDGFQRGGESVTADVRKGRASETLCVVSVVDTRGGEPVRLVCFGTENASSEGLETFSITEGARFWDIQLAREHLGLLYERQFKKLAGKGWQEAFTTTEERDQAEKLLDVCTRKAPRVADIQEVVLDLLDTIAKGFGLKKKPNTERRLQAFELPPDHDIGIDSEERTSKFGGHNPFGGVTLRDERSRLLGYIIYPLKAKGDAARLRRHLEEHNRFHNVLVVYPDQDQASLELWQGREQLTGKLRRGHGYRDSADIVNLLSRFFVVSKAKVRNPSELAQELAYRARYLRRLAVRQLQEEPQKGPLRDLYNAFTEALIHNQSEPEFADAFAQTITYGLLSARWTANDALLAGGERLTRHTALKYLSSTSPFLNDLFKTALSVRLDEQRGRLLWLVDDIADLLDRIDVIHVFGAGDIDSDTATDPVIHFYEPFLAAYDKDLKNKRGVFFTPRPVVTYIVRSVHELLQAEFGLQDGLASTDTWGDVASRRHGLTIPDGVAATDTFVRILDPATGTGTFLFECIGIIERTLKEKWCGELQTTDWHNEVITSRWSQYVIDHLLPRLFAYELMVASYAVAHLKLALKLAATGVHLTAGSRLNVYLTNSLEPPSSAASPKVASLFATLAREARDVDRLKREHRVTVVLGNPPYSKMSGNLSPGAVALVEPFRYLEGQRIVEKGALAFELNLQDDYVKFWGFLSRTLDDTGIGVGGLITNSRYLSSPSLRGLRFVFSRQCSNGYFLDLGGQISERPAGGAVDENVFDIEQGVAIGVLVCKPDAPRMTTVRTGRLLGSRREKYEWLQANSVRALDTTVTLSPPSFRFSRSEGDVDVELARWPALEDIMPFNSGAIITSRDNLALDFDKSTLLAKIDRFATARANDRTIEEEIGYSVKSKWDVEACKRSIRKTKNRAEYVRSILYRPFDKRFIYYWPPLLDTPSRPVSESVFGHTNLVLLTPRVKTTSAFTHVFVSQQPAEKKACSHDRATQMFPLYAYTSSGLLTGKSVNITTGLCEEERAGDERAKVAEFYYIYAVLHSPGYRARYGAALRDSYPRIPIAKTRGLFIGVSNLGEELVRLHTGAVQAVHVMKYRGVNSPAVARISHSDNTVWLDSDKRNGFAGVREDIWQFDVGGYQVCEKWLKDRRDRALRKSDIDHYLTVLGAIAETIRIMSDIDQVVRKHGGWPGAFVTDLAGSAS